jgi:Ca-activated chloride channel family protein
MLRARRPLFSLLAAITALGFALGGGCMSASDNAPTTTTEAPSTTPTAKTDVGAGGLVEERKPTAVREKKPTAPKAEPSTTADALRARGSKDVGAVENKLLARQGPSAVGDFGGATTGLSSSTLAARDPSAAPPPPREEQRQMPQPKPDAAGRSAPGLFAGEDKTREDTSDIDGAISQGGGFAAVAVNPWVKTADDTQSTFAIDVDTASYTFARRYLERGQRPPQGSVRVEEFVNAFHYSYAPPTDDAFRVHLAAAPSPLGRGHHLVRVAVKGQEVSNAARAPVHLTFLVDTSGSMGASDKLPLAQQALHHLVDNLRDDDSIALITYAGSTQVILEQTKVAKKRSIHDAIDRLRTGGGTNMGSGMELAYKNAHRYLSSESESRVIVLSDGDANIGRTTHGSILDAVKGYVSEGVTLSTVGFGTGNYQDTTMEQLANAGNGNYSYIDSMKAAKKVFGTDLAGTLQVIAKDVKIQVEFNPDTVKRYRLLGYENRDIADHEFRNDKVDAGEIGSGHSVTALYEVELNDDVAGSTSTLANVHVRAKTPKGVKATESTFALDGRDVADRFGDLDRDTRFAMALALAGEVLRGSAHAEGFTLEDAYHLASEAADGPYAEERQEFVTMLGRVAPSAGVAVR